MHHLEVKSGKIIKQSFIRGGGGTEILPPLPDLRVGNVI